MIRKYLFLLLFFIIGFPELSFPANSATQNLTMIEAKRFAKLWYYNPQEKVYLQTDKPYYSAGENIWFSAYLMNAATLQPNTKSRYIYVELIDRSDSVISRVKIRKDSIGFSGYIRLSSDIQAGEYCLRAYTYWMQNEPTDYFFHKYIYIGNQVDDRIKVSAGFMKAENSKIDVSVHFTNTFQTPIQEKDVVVNLIGMKDHKRKFIKTTDKNGEIKFQVNADTSSVSKGYIEVFMKEPGHRFKNKIFLPSSKKDFDIQFFPESGTFLNNDLQHIGFKAIGTDGFSVNVSGTIYNQQNEEITSFVSEHKGMGRIVFKTNPGENYYAVVKSSDGLVKKVSLPPTDSVGVALHLSFNRGIIQYQLLNRSGFPDQSLYLLVHSRGVVYFTVPFKKEIGQIPERILPAGIASFSVIDSLGNTYCERLFFIRNFQFPTTTMTSDKPAYGKRDLVNLSFKVKKANGLPMDGHLSLSVTDSKMVKEDSLSMNIVNNLLLTSDLQGYIEDPGEYFVDNSNRTREITDVLMLTQGWRRFSTPSLVKGKLKKPRYYLEAGQTVSGKVLNIFGKPAKDRNVILFSGYKNRIAITKTDSLGRFVVEGIEFPDSTNIVVKAKSKVKIVDVELICDKDQFPRVKVKIPYKAEVKDKVPESFLMLSKRKYYDDGGMLNVNLGEFTVNAKKEKMSPEEEMYSQLADNVIDQDRLQDLMGLQLLDILATVPGVQVTGQNISIRGSRGNPLFVVDGIETDNIDDILYLNTSDIKSIYVFKGVGATTFGSRGGNGVIAIMLKSGADLSVKESSSLEHIKPLGYQKPKEFYVPKYQVDSVRLQNKEDLRTTIYWNPEIKPDSTGIFHVSFYTADKNDNYRVELEGLGNKGEICRFKGLIKREDE